MMVYKNFVNLLRNFKLGTLSSPHPTRWLITLMAILPFLGLSKGRLVSLLRVARGEPLTETQRHGENFLLGTPTSSSASSPLSGFSIFRRPSCMLDSSVSHPIRIPAWISTSLGSLRWGCSMQGGDLRGGISGINS